MPDPSTLRDSTQIVLPPAALEGFREDLDERFTLTFFEVDRTTPSDGDGREPEDGAEDVTGDDGSETPGGDDANPEIAYVRIIGSPVEIKAASEFLARNGVSLR